MLNVTEALRRRRQDGEGKIGLIIVLVVIAFIVIVLVKYVPAKVRNATYAKDVEVTARQFVVGEIRGGEPALIHRLISAASDEGITIDEEAIQIDDTTQYLRVTVDYGIVLNMPWGEWPQQFHIEKEVPKL